MRALAIIAVIAVSSGAARAETEPGYESEVFAVDAAALAAAAAIAYGARDEFRGPPNRLQTFAGTWWLLSTVVTPGVHFARGSRLGWASLGVRLTAPLLVSGIAGLGYCMTQIEEREGGSSSFARGCEDRGLPAGLIAGTAAAAALDAWLLARPRQIAPRDRGRWYGWQTLAVDGAGLALGLYVASQPPTGAELERGEPYTRTFDIAMSMYVTGMLAAPWVHVGHGHGLRALGDFGVRSFLPPVAALGGMIGWCIGTAGSGSGSCIDSGFEVGLLGGSVLASVIDSFVLAREREAPTETRAWAPGVALERGGARFTLSTAL